MRPDTVIGNFLTVRRQMPSAYPYAQTISSLTLNSSSFTARHHKRGDKPPWGQPLDTATLPETPPKAAVASRPFRLAQIHRTMVSSTHVWLMLSTWSHRRCCQTLHLCLQRHLRQSPADQEPSQPVLRVGEGSFPQPSQPGWLGWIGWSAKISPLKNLSTKLFMVFNKNDVRLMGLKSRGPQ